VIRLITEKIGSALSISVLMFAVFCIILGYQDSTSLFKVSILFLEGLLLNFLCFRYSIIGQKNNAVLVIFTILSVLVLPEISVKDLLYGLVCLGAFFLAFESREQPKYTRNYLIYFGLLLGVSQLTNSISVLLLIPAFLLFIQTGTRDIRGFLLSIFYFVIIVIAFSCILYVVDLPDKISSLIPNLTFDYLSFDTILYKLFLPFLLLSILIHFLSLNTYRFRFPNKSKILNFTMLIQLLIVLALIVITADNNLIIYAVMMASVLLSFAFVYKRDNIFANSAFLSLFCIALASLYLYQILIL